MKRLYAPWRHSYVTNIARNNNKKLVEAAECVFCTRITKDDDDTFFIVKRFPLCFVIMNFYPYNIGHLMVLPYEHKADLVEINQETRAEMMHVVSLTTTILTQVVKAGGFNIGINLGVAGGGGLPAHLHIHVLPRWQGDTNFLETIGEVKLLTTDFEKVFYDLKKAFFDTCLPE